MHRIKGRGLVELVSSVLNISQTQSQHTVPADQSEHSVLFRRRDFTETGSKQSVTDRLGIEEVYFVFWIHLCFG